jgi:hypothetical protein
LSSERRSSSDISSSKLTSDVPCSELEDARSIIGLELDRLVSWFSESKFEGLGNKGRKRDLPDWSEAVSELAKEETARDTCLEVVGRCNYGLDCFTGLLLYSLCFRAFVSVNFVNPSIQKARKSESRKSQTELMIRFFSHSLARGLLRGRLDDTVENRRKLQEEYPK